MIDHITFGVDNYEESLFFYKETLACLYSSHDLNIEERTIPPVVKEVEIEDPQTKYCFKVNATVFRGVRFASFIHNKLKCGFSIIDLNYGILEEALSPNFYGSPKGSTIAFKADTKEQVDKWYAKAIELGAKCNGAPGARPGYGPDDYGAFVIDLSGNKIEVVLNTAFSTGIYHV